MHKMQVEEMRDFFSQKNNFEEISAIPQTRHPCIRGYLSSQSNLFPKEKEFLPRSLKTICKQ